MSTLVPQAININGLAPAYAAAAAGGDAVAPGDRTFLHFKNTTGAAITVTVAVPGAEYGVNRADVPVIVPATTGDRMVGPLPNDLRDPITGLVAITYSAAGLTVAALTL